MKQIPEKKKSAKIKYEIKKNIESNYICLAGFEDAIKSHPRITKDLAKSAIKFQYKI